MKNRVTNIILLLLASPFIMAPGGSGETTGWTIRVLEEKLVSDTVSLVLYGPEVSILGKVTRDDLANDYFDIFLQLEGRSPDIFGDDLIQMQLTLENNGQLSDRIEINKAARRLEQKNRRLLEELKIGMSQSPILTLHETVRYQIVGQQIINAFGKHLTPPICLRQLVRQRLIVFNRHTFQDSVAVPIDTRSLSLADELSNCH